jgi:hypothetical protein
MNDRMSVSTHFEVIAMGINNTDTNDGDIARDVRFLKETPFLPVSSKLMFMLHLADVGRYISIFQQWDCAGQKFDEKVDAILDGDQDSVNYLKEYIWLMEAPGLYSAALKSCKGDSSKAFDLLNTFREDTMDEETMFICRANQIEIW